VTIQPDVRGVAKDFGLDPIFVQAIVQAEGNLLRAVQCSIPSVETRDQALRVLCRSIVHALRDYVAQQGQASDFVAFFGRRWAPVGAANDPQHLNANWTDNVRRLAHIA
jgi:hypothetical protein